MRHRGIAHAIVLASAFLVATAGARADAVADFYRGKTITIVIGYSPGGGYDTYAASSAASSAAIFPAIRWSSRRKRPAAAAASPPTEGQCGAARRHSTPPPPTNHSPSSRRSAIRPFSSTPASSIGSAIRPPTTKHIWRWPPCSASRPVADATTKEIVIGATGINTSSQQRECSIGGRHQIQDRARLSRRHRRGAALALERGEIGDIPIHGRAGSPKSPSGSPTRRSISWSRSACSG